MILIGLTGPAGVGKTTAANLLGQMAGFEMLAFADPIRALALSVVPRWAEWHMGPGKDIHDAHVGCAPRDVLRAIGDHARSWQWDVFIRLLARRVGQLATAGVPGVVVHDVRTHLEAEWLRQFNCFERIERSVLIHLQREGCGFRGDHETEMGVSAEPGDLVVRNPGTLQGLRGELTDALVGLRLQLVA